MGNFIAEDFLKCVAAILKAPSSSLDGQRLHIRDMFSKNTHFLRDGAREGPRLIVCVHRTMEALRAIEEKLP